ncbi:MAG TPA: Ppx/GppA phosphatase family protein [Candidatus Kapabacteria bacterium]|nr:Ppx/GppA phosphatase family protein [Candidatus Kapabacteria bacterium]
MRIASIDIGSNSIKLLVAELTARGALLPLKREKSMVRLGHETLIKGHLSSEAIVKAIRTLGVFKTLAQSLGAKEIVVIATASVREADNEAAFIREVESRTGLRIEVLSGVEEARLIGLAAAHELSHFSGKRKGAGGSRAGSTGLLNIDIGGGSTELSLMRGTKAKMLHSIKIGAVRLTEQFLSNDPPKTKELLAMRREIEAALERPVREMKGEEWAVTSGTSGTILSIGAAFQSIAYPDTESVAGEKAIGARMIAQPGMPSITMTRGELAKFNKHIASISISERKKIPGISDQRAEIIVAGGMVLEQTMLALKINRIRTCEWSLREGVLLDRFSETGGTRERNAQSDAHLAGAEALGERFGYEAAHGKQVAMLAQKLFDQLKTLHGMKPHDRTLLAAAAILHDIGYAISAEAHHKHSLYLILNSELTGFTDLERQIIANVARYHRRAFPKAQHEYFSRLPMEDQGKVWMLGGILRLADAMDRSHESRVKNFKATLRGDRVRLELKSARRSDHERWAIEHKKDMFEEAFGVTLELV